jgi:hypothetical protein
MFSIYFIIVGHLLGVSSAKLSVGEQKGIDNNLTALVGGICNPYN